MRLALLPVLLFALACTPNEGDDLAQQGTPSESSTATASTPGDTQSTAGSTLPVLPVEKDEPASRAGGVALPAQDVQLLEYRVNMPDTLKAGVVRFGVENAGKEKHAFEIEGNGVHAKTNPLSRGDSTQLDVDLKPGTYTVYCPIPGHKEKGMTRTIQVQ